MIQKKKWLSFLIILGFCTFIIPTRSINQSEAYPSQQEQDIPYKILFVMDESWGGNVPSIIGRFEQDGWNITTTAVNKTINGCSYVDYAPFEVDIELTNLTDIFSYDCVSILPGSSHTNLLDNEEFHEMLQKFVTKGIIVSAWCTAVRILARADVIQGKNVTGNVAYQSEYENSGAIFFNEVPPIADGNIITSVRSNFYQEETCELIKITVVEYKPEFLDFSTYLGGTADESGIDAELHYLGDTTVDSQGDIIVIGRTSSNDFPILNAYQTHRNGGIDITISKFSPKGNLIFSTYFGGNAHEWATGVVIDSDDNIIFGGITGSNNFPLQNPYQSECKGGWEGNADCFITKLSADGQTLLYSSYFGGTEGDWCYEIDVDNEGRIGITGTTLSNDIPIVNAYQNSIAGAYEAYVTVFEADGQALAYSTYLGSRGFDHGRGLEFDDQGNLYLTGMIEFSSHGTNNVFQQDHLGSMDGYLAKFNKTGSLDYFTYLGGSSFDRANDLILDPAGNILITGFTYSTDFPMKNAFKTEIEGGHDIFITKFDPYGRELLFSTYYGGDNTDFGYAISCDDQGNFVITGETHSTNFYTTYDIGENEDNSNSFVLKIREDGQLLFSTLIGGNLQDVGVGITWYSNQSYILTGFTKSDNFPIFHGTQGEYKGNCDMFVMKVDTANLELEIKVFPPWKIGVITVSTLIGGFGIAYITIFLRRKKFIKK